MTLLVSLLPRPPSTALAAGCRMDPVYLKLTGPARPSAPSCAFLTFFLHPCALPRRRSLLELSVPAPTDRF
ncbi:hypothetical protein C8Q78DRAFT_1042950 [Trametes maxima]|nr:hypothetical protein C8Q78DRAFT_1042950 [Trametes maxima]